METHNSMMAKVPKEGVFSRKRLVFFTLDDFFLYHFRLPLMLYAQALGAEVFAIAPPGPFAARFAEHGVRFVPFPIDRRTFSPWKAWRTIRQLQGIFEALEPHLVHTFAHRPNGYAGLALRRSSLSTRFIATVTGLGSLYVRNDPKTRLQRWMTETTLRQAFQRADAVVFQNQDDRWEFLRKGLCDFTQTYIIPGSGVDVHHFDPKRVSVAEKQRLYQRYELSQNKPIVLMVSRLIRDKGVLEFLHLAQHLRARAQFVLVGGPDPGNPKPLLWDEIRQQAASAGVLLPGFQEDVRIWLSIADIFVVPSYREGMPRTVLEAMAMALPVVATNVPGCRDAVKDGWNGLLVPPRDVSALAKAVATLLRDERLRDIMGKRGRERAVHLFSIQVIIEQYARLYQKVLRTPQ